MNNCVYIRNVGDYDAELIRKSLPDNIFAIIQSGNTVVLKPNWVKESHLQKKNDWEYIITHPAVIEAVLLKVLERLNHAGRIIITDSPQTDCNYEKLISRYPQNKWTELCKEHGITLEFIDLRDDEWIQQDGVIVKRTKLSGDPRGSVTVNLRDQNSEFFDHNKPKRGYYGADYNLSETNNAHNGHDNIYKISRSVIEADVFINIPKLKTHKKAGITCCLKNLVGINTYKNYLPHHSEGSLSEGGDQFPVSNVTSKVEGRLVAFVRAKLLTNTRVANLLRPFRKIGLNIFGQSSHVIRSGNWYGNDTLWRMVLDLNKALFYSNPEGSFTEDDFVQARHYIGIVDAIIAGEGNGPLESDPIKMNYLICGTNPVAIDSVAAVLMGFDPKKIPSIRQAFSINNFKICGFNFEDILILNGDSLFGISSVPQNYILKCKPATGWVNHIEADFSNMLTPSEVLI